MNNSSGWNYTDNNLMKMKSLEKEYYLNQDAKTIFDALKSQLVPVSFGMRLKRYIRNHEKELFPGSPDEYPMEKYRKLIIQKFDDHHVPNSFEETSSTLMQSVKNWLEANSVDRNVVFLLGFAFQMPIKDVNDMLLNGLQQEGINAKSPREVICYWCYKNKYPFEQYKSFEAEYDNLEPSGNDWLVLSMYGETVYHRNELLNIRTDEDLIKYLAGLKTEENEPIYSVTAKKHYEALYKETQILVSELMNHTAEYTKSRTYAPSDITEADIETIISAAIPRQNNGNLVKASLADIHKQVADRRFTRQRANNILKGKTEINRFDLITLCFLNHALNIDRFKTPAAAYEAYIRNVNKILDDCYLAHIYPGNLYECMILLCMLTEDPLANYSEIYEYAYSGQI